MKKNYVKKIILLLILPVCFFVLTAGGGGGGGGKSGKDSNGGKTFDPNYNAPITVTCGTQTCKLYLYLGNLNPNTIPNRSGGYGSFQPTTGNIFNGGNSEINSTSNTTNNFCSITITATNCASYGTGGSKTFIWDTSNDGNLFDAAMDINIPDSSGFTIKITLYEGAGPFYTGFNNYNRAIWTHEQTYFPTPTIGIDKWQFSRFNN